MGWLGWLADNWWLVAERGAFVASILFAAFSLRENTRERRLQNLLRLTERHHKVVSELLSEPRILDASVAAPAPTQKEVHSVNFLLLHLQSAYKAHESGMHRLPKKIGADIRLLLSYPIPGAVWERVKGSHDERFVAFVERARSGEGEPARPWWRRR